MREDLHGALTSRSESHTAGYSDQNRAIAIIVKSQREVDAIRDLLVEARARFRQEAMYLEYHEVYFEEVR